MPNEGTGTMKQGRFPISANLSGNATIYIKMLRIGYADAGRGNLPRLLCPLQNAGSPKYSASSLWYRTGATPTSLLASRQQLKVPLRLRRLCTEQNTKGF